MQQEQDAKVTAHLITIDIASLPNEMYASCVVAMCITIIKIINLIKQSRSMPLSPLAASGSDISGSARGSLSARPHLEPRTFALLLHYAIIPLFMCVLARSHNRFGR
jgi:hypothetical protein